MDCKWSKTRDHGQDHYQDRTRAQDHSQAFHTTIGPGRANLKALTIDNALSSDDQDQKGGRDRGELTITHTVYGLSDFCTKTSGRTSSPHLKSTPQVRLLLVGALLDIHL